jgi:hypothetical protein
MTLTLTALDRDVADGRYGSRFMAERDIIAAASRIIREADDAALQAIVRSTNPRGPLWGAAAMAQAELDRRNVAAFNSEMTEA